MEKGPEQSLWENCRQKNENKTFPIRYIDSMNHISKVIKLFNVKLSKKI